MHCSGGVRCEAKAPFAAPWPLPGESASWLPRGMPLVLKSDSESRGGCRRFRAGTWRVTGSSWAAVEAPGGDLSTLSQGEPSLTCSPLAGRALGWGPPGSEFQSLPFPLPPLPTGCCRRLAIHLRGSWVLWPWRLSPGLGPRA